MSQTALLILALISSAIPMLVAVITHEKAPAALKAVALLAMSAIAGFVTAWQADPHYDWQRGALAALGAFGIAVLTHFGLLKPVGVTGSTGVIQKSLISAGLGKPHLGPRHRLRLSVVTVPADAPPVVLAPPSAPTVTIVPAAPTRSDA